MNPESLRTACFLAALAAFFSRSGSEPVAPVETPGRVVATSVEIVDEEGRTVIRLDSPNPGRGVLTFFDDQGDERLHVGLLDQAEFQDRVEIEPFPPKIVFNSPKKSAHMSVGIHETGEPHVECHAEGSRAVLIAARERALLLLDGFKEGEETGPQGHLHAVASTGETSLRLTRRLRSQPWYSIKVNDEDVKVDSGERK
ncbi:MAG: hypothetical protein R3F20_09050 [Planctomycetota bacterium]